MRIFVALFILSLTLTACPNNCNGNGVCRVDGTCECYRQTGLALNGAYFEDYTYTGTDCSLRTCPKNFAFAGDSNSEPWSNHDGPELVLTGEAAYDSKDNIPGVPNKPYIRKLTMQNHDKALSEYGLGGSMSCYENSHKRIFSRSYTILTFSSEVNANDIVYNYYGIVDINKSGVDDLPQGEKLYCYVEYVRKDLSLFINFQFATLATKAEESSTVTLRKDLSTILMGYFKGKAISATDAANAKDYKVACIRSDKEIESKGMMKIIESTVKMYKSQCSEYKDGKNCISVAMAYNPNYNSGDRCFLLENGYNREGETYREITLEASELYHYIGRSNSDYIFGKYLENAALGYYLPQSVQYEDQIGTIYTEQPTGTPYEQDTYAKDNDTVFIDFTKFCNGLKCNKLTSDTTLKTFGQFYQYISLGQHVNVIRLLTTREVEDNSAIGAAATNAANTPTIIENHACYAHFIQLTILNYEITPNGVFIKFNRPYHFVSKSAYNHYAYLFQFLGNGIHKAVECSGVGECDRTTGTCNCLPGYDGDACQRFSCPNKCSEHGRCITINELYTGDDQKYNGFGNDKSENGRFMTCKCDPGFKGPDCSLKECPTGVDPIGGTNKRKNSESGKEFDDKYEVRDCSGRGICDYTTGTCACFEGFYGADCTGVNSF